LEEFKKSEFKHTLEEDLNDHLSCNIQMDPERVTGWIGQPLMDKKIKKVASMQTELHCSGNHRV